MHTLAILGTRTMLFKPLHFVNYYGMCPHIYSYSNIPLKLPSPKNQEWIQNLREVLALELLSYAQYTADAEKFNAYMPYMMVIPQEEYHIETIKRLFVAYGLPSDVKVGAVTETKTLPDAYELCVKMERDLIPHYELLVKNAEDHDTAGILNNLLLQTRHHLVMFEHALQMGGRGMGPGYGYGFGPGMMRGW